MCGRFAAKVKSGEALPMKWRELHALLSGNNIAPSQSLFAVLSGTGRAGGTGGGGEPEPAKAKWGLTTSWRPELIINARAETVATKPSFRKAFLERRCIVPADGWYEWQKRRGGKQPYFIHARSNEPFAFAGIWEPDEHGSPTVAIITTAATPSIAMIHNRMPAVLLPDQWPHWLAAQTPADALGAMLKPAADNWPEAYPVSSRVNSPRFNDAACMEPIADPGVDADANANAAEEPGLFG
jgi:putative SOS response-associated peptidase YedK